ncbi:ABC transporter ATP-binding protein, partial [Mesorhizobium sp. M2D.F.Ca.ET.178.01.1.1]
MASILRLSLFRDIAGFGAVMARIGGRRTWIALAFLVLGSLTEGVSILLLIPLLHLIGKSDQDFAIRLPDNALLHWLAPGGTLGLAT